MRRIAIAMGMAAFLFAGCVSAQQPSPAGFNAGAERLPAAAPTAYSVEAEIAPVSRSNPSPEAAEVLDLCDVGRIGADKVAGMGLVPSARDVVKYVPLYGTEPELKTDHPAWVISFSGKITYRGYWAIDPVCIVIDGVPMVTGSGEYGHGNVARKGPPVPNAPTVRLPALAP
jgi:hypothetical protein